MKNKYKIFTTKEWTFEILDEELFYQHVKNGINLLISYNIISPYKK